MVSFFEVSPAPSSLPGTMAVSPSPRWASILLRLTCAQLRDGFSKREAMSRHRGAWFSRPAALREPMSSTSTGFDLRSDPVAMMCDSFDIAGVRGPGRLPGWRSAWRPTRGEYKSVGVASDRCGPEGKDPGAWAPWVRMGGPAFPANLQDLGPFMPVLRKARLCGRRAIPLQPWPAQSRIDCLPQLFGRNA